MIDILNFSQSDKAYNLLIINILNNIKYRLAIFIFLLATLQCAADSPLTSISFWNISDNPMVQKTGCLNGLKNLNIKFAWIVNSEDGLDEISPYAKTNVTQLKDGIISEIIIDPKTLNINAEKFDNLIGDDAKFNADKMIEVFKGKDNDFSKAVCLNAAAGLIVSEKFINFLDAYNFSREFILSGKPYSYLEKIQNV